MARAVETFSLARDIPQHDLAEDNLRVMPKLLDSAEAIIPALPMLHPHHKLITSAIVSRPAGTLLLALALTRTIINQ